MGDNLSSRISELDRRIEELRMKVLDEPDNAAEILSDALKELQISLEELSSAEEELYQQNEELITAQEEREKHLMKIEEANETLRLVNGLAEYSLKGEPFQESLQAMLATAKKLVRAKAVSIAVYRNPDILDAWIYNMGGAECQVKSSKGIGDHFPEIAEKFAHRTIIKNDTSDILSPPGHIPLKNFLSKSADIKDGWVHLNFADKDGGFSEEDARKADTFAHIASMIVDRARADEREHEARCHSERRASELDATISSIADAMLIYGPTGEVLRMNAPAQAMFDFSVEDCRLPIAERLALLRLEKENGSGFEEKDSSVWRALQGEIVRDNIMILRRRTDGKALWVSSSSAPIYGPDGQLLGAVATFKDITELKQAVEELRKARDELELRVRERTVELSGAKEELEVINEELQVEILEHEKTEKDLLRAKVAAEAAVVAKAAFLANMSHELRTPMNAVIGFSSLLLDESLTPVQKDYIESIRNGGEALLAIINDILEFSRAEKEKVELEHQPLSLKHCIEESLDLVAVQADKKGLNLTYTVNYGTPDAIIGDHGRLRQILVNLLSNAIKFTDEGEVSVSVSSKAVEDNKRQILFTVRDTGMGISLDKMDRIFQSFTQLERTISRKRDGVGLGLAISKKLVELMGGEIWAESEEGKGSTFHFTIQAEALPGKQLDLGETERDAAYENLSGQKPMAILVAEDNPSNQKVLVEMLKRMGYRADAVADGKEVLQSLERQPYDLVLMDVRMPEMDGITATQVIRKLRPKNGPKIIAITAYALEGDREKCLEAGMDDYISKPVKMSELVEVLNKYQPAQKSS